MPRGRRTVPGTLNAANCPFSEARCDRRIQNARARTSGMAAVDGLIVTGRRRAAAVAIAGGVALAIVTMAGSEPLIFTKFYVVTTANLTSPANGLGPPDWARAIGLPGLVVAWLPRTILLVGVAAMWAARRRPGVAWAIGALLMWLASPVVALHTPALALVAIAPVAWPVALDRVRESPEG